jgi:hypothetical protein
MACMNRLLALLLALIVVVTSQQLALARGQSVSAGTMTLCIGGGFVTVAVDAKGQPVGPAHACPDGIAAFAGAVGVTPDLGSRIATFRVVVVALQDASAAHPLYVRVVQARAPPQLA